MANKKIQNHHARRMVSFLHQLPKSRYDFISSFPIAILVTLLLLFSSVVYNTPQVSISSFKYSIMSTFGLSPGGPNLFFFFNNNNSGEKPTMHTFFTPILNAGNTPAGMSQQAHQALLEAWEKAWQDAGWNTKVLTVHDAKKHPQFEPLSRIIQTFDMGEYDRLCFIRWIAMAASENGGGWMADYDVFPLHDFRHEGGYHGNTGGGTPLKGLPNNGAFTLHDGFVPSLASGTKSEWFRMIKLLVDHAQIVRSRSDMFAVEELGQKDGTLFKVDHTVMPGNNALTGKEWTWECRALTYPPNKRAVHFSHHAISEGRLQQGQTLEDRAEIASQWLQMWLEKCGRKAFDPNEKQIFLRH